MSENAVITPSQALTIDVDASIQVPALYAANAMAYTFAQAGAAIQMRIEDVYSYSRHTWVRLHEKGGKQHEIPC